MGLLLIVLVVALVSRNRRDRKKAEDAIEFVVMANAVRRKPSVLDKDWKQVSTPKRAKAPGGSRRIQPPDATTPNAYAESIPPGAQARPTSAYGFSDHGDDEVFYEYEEVEKTGAAPRPMATPKKEKPPPEILDGGVYGEVEDAGATPVPTVNAEALPVENFDDEYECPVWTGPGTTPSPNVASPPAPPRRPPPLNRRSEPAAYATLNQATRTPISPDYEYVEVSDTPLDVTAIQGVEAVADDDYYETPVNQWDTLQS